MNQCTEFAALLDPYLDGELSAGEREAVAAHLAQCAACRAYVEDGLAIRAALPQVEETAVPEGFAQAVMEAVARSPQLASPAAKRAARPWVRTFASLAAACFVLAVALGALPGRRGARSAMDTASVTASAPAGANQSAAAGADIPPAAPAAAPAEVPAEAPETQVESAGPESEESAAGADSWKSSTFTINPAAAAPSAYDAYDDAGGDGAEAPAPAAAQADQQEKARTNGREAVFQAEIPAEQADLLADYPLDRDESGEEVYLLTAEEYQALAAALEARGVAPDPLPEGAETVWVSVKQG